MAEGCAASIISLFLLPFQMAFDGWALMLLWAWYVSPATGWPEVGFITAAGLTLLRPILAYRYSQADVDAEDEYPRAAMLVAKFMFGILLTAMALFVGWVLHFVA